VLDQRGRLLVAALGFAGLTMPSYDRTRSAPGLTPCPRLLEASGQRQDDDDEHDQAETPARVVAPPRAIGPRW
jgi:hypothetical protein